MSRYILVGARLDITDTGIKIRGEPLSLMVLDKWNLEGKQVNYSILIYYTSPLINLIP